MAVRRPLVRVAGVTRELPAGDTLPSNVQFTASGALPPLALLGTATITLTVAPVNAGDALVAGEAIVVTPGAALPAGYNIGWAIATGPTTIQIALSAVVAIVGTTQMSWKIVALR